MYKFKVTDKNGSIEYFGEMDLLEKMTELGHGLPERPELDQDGNTTGNIIPADYTVEITDISQEYALQQCLENRKAEYPTPEEFMNAFFDGGEIAVQELQNKRLQIKAKYPKPTIPQE